MKTAFAIMAIRPETDAAWDALQSGINSNRAGLVAHRADLDEHAFIIEGILRAIDGAAAVVVDLTPEVSEGNVPRWNANVLFEFGYAVAKGKAALVLCENARAPARFPFDIAHQRVRFYESPNALKGIAASFDFGDPKASSFAGRPDEANVSSDAEGRLAVMALGQRREMARETNDYFVFLRGKPECARRFVTWCRRRKLGVDEEIQRVEHDALKVAGTDYVAQNKMTIAIVCQKVKVGFLVDLLQNIDEASDEDDVAWWLAKTWAWPKAMAE